MTNFIFIASWLGPILYLIFAVWFIIKINSIDRSLKDISKKIDKE